MIIGVFGDEAFSEKAQRTRPSHRLKWYLLDRHLTVVIEAVTVIDVLMTQFD